MREMRFRELELRSIAAGLAGAVVGIGSAIAGYGPWALIAQITTMNALRTGLVWVTSDWRPTLDFSWSAWREIRRFSRNVLATNILYFLNTNTDNLIVGKFLGPAPLGIYRLSYNVMLLPIYRVVVPIRNVVFPAFSKIQDDRERMLAAWIRVTRILLAIVLPTVVGLVVTAPDFVGVLLGHRWHGAVPVIMALALVGVLQSLQRLNDSVMQACGRTGQQLCFAATAFATNLVAFLVGVRWGVVGVAVGAAIGSALVQPFYMVSTARALGVTVGRTLHGVRRIAAATAAMGVATLLLRLALTSAGLTMVPRFAVEVVAGVAIFTVMLRWLDPGLVAECRAAVAHARRGLGRSGRRPQAALMPE
jgi:O-antigen/teichoic acid export membrane protein